jgi:hypothetical protein
VCVYVHTVSMHAHVHICVCAGMHKLSLKVVTGFVYDQYIIFTIYYCAGLSFW